MNTFEDLRLGGNFAVGKISMVIYGELRQSGNVESVEVLLKYTVKCIRGLRPRAGNTPMGK